ncbi:MAG: Zn-dependent hydrolase [Salinisphaera sp.]|jgi:N-carbamoyl-L-amino-acid hydrolase|nr:Zn-dependent hydrolase [Salinisphaera sp.]
MDVAIDGERLWTTIMETAKIGATPAGGLTRLALSDSDRAVRDWFADACRQAGCEVSVDDMGNMFARRPGRNERLAPILIGSHLDSQPLGGRFDGVLGVLAALEAVRALNDAQIQTDHPIEVVNWTNEEGARFPPAMLSSGVFAGVFSTEEAYGHEDADGLRFGDELERIGYRGPLRCGDKALAGYLELHIEQGPVLEAGGDDIGVVTGVQGMRWYELAIDGFAGHSGTTPMALRRDALVGAARVVHALDALARSLDDQAVATVGILRPEPGSRNVVPGRVTMTIDLRHPSSECLGDLEQRMETRINALCDELDLAPSLSRIWDSAPVTFDTRCVEAVRSAARRAGFSHRDIVSGAGHDAVYISRVAPTSMIFVPCEKGISHNEAESIEPQHAAAGAQTLAGAVLDIDRILA